MYREAYNLLREVLDDDQLNEYIFTGTGKHLAVIDAGAKVTRSMCEHKSQWRHSYTQDKLKH